jgi:hypothetical protein
MGAQNPLLPDAELPLGLVGEWGSLDGGGQSRAVSRVVLLNRMVGG